QRRQSKCLPRFARRLTTSFENRFGATKLCARLRGLERHLLALLLELKTRDSRRSSRQLARALRPQAVEQRPGKLNAHVSIFKPPTVLTDSRRRRTRRARRRVETTPLLRKAEARRRKRLKADLEEVRDRGEQIGASGSYGQVTTSRHQLGGAQRRAILECSRIEIRRDERLCRVGIDGARQHQRPLEGDVQQAFEVELRQITVVLRLDRQRLDIGPFHFRAQHIVLRRPTRALKLLNLRETR